MKSLAVLALTCISPCFLVACADDETVSKIPIDKVGTPVEPKLIGRVASIPTDKRFILVQSYGPWNTTAGTILISRGADNRTANLLVTGETIGQYAAADLQAGTLEVGDAVYSREIQRIVPPAAPPEPIDTKATRPF